MTYGSLDLLVDRYGQGLILTLADRADPPAGMIDAAIVARALSGADATINASLAVRYQLPLSDVPELIVDVALAIAIYKLHRFTPEAKIKDEYDQALKDLADIAKGTKQLDVAGIAPASAGGGEVIATDRPRMLTPESLRGFI